MSGVYVLEDEVMVPFPSPKSRALSTEHFFKLYGLVDGTEAVVLRHMVIVEGKGNDPEGSVSHGFHTRVHAHTLFWWVEKRLADKTRRTDTRTN